MSSSCVPPKNCVILDSDSSGHDDQSDTSSECGSLCTCTSSSMASIATTDRAPEINSAALVAPPTTSQIAPQVSRVERDSRYLAIRMQQRTASVSERSRCSSCHKNSLLVTSLRQFLLSMSEFFPWVAGFVIIYYSYCWWGIGSGFSAFLFMIGAHAVIRLVRTRGVLSCVTYSSQPHVESNPHSESEDEAEPEQHHAVQEVRVDWSTEKPPSYDVAVVRPPPYDLQYHLTPQHPGNDLPVKLHRSSEETLIVPSKLTVDDSDSDRSLPSYHEAMRLSLYNDAGDHKRRDGES